MEEKAIYFMFYLSSYIIFFSSKDANLNLMPAKPFKAKNTCLEHCTDWHLNWWQVIPINQPWKAQSFALCETRLYKKSTWVFLVDDKLSFTVRFET